MIKANSPLLAKVEVVKYGSNQLRKKMNHIPELELTANRLLEPIVKGKNFKARTATVKKHTTEKSKQKDLETAKGKARKQQVQLDRPENYWLATTEEPTQLKLNLYLLKYLLLII